MENEIYDAVVVGSGAAGLMFAIELEKNGKIAVLTKDKIIESNTKYAQGGIAAVLRIDDDYANHIEDTIKAGAGICDVEMVKILVHEAPARIRDFMNWGVEFDRDKDNRLLFTQEGGHRSWRILHVGDMTGWAIEECLIKKAFSCPNIEVLEHKTVLDLIVKNNICYGVTVLDEKGKIRHIAAKLVFLATGGAGQLYSHTTNPVISTGDGIAMAYRAGASVDNMEFIQFHPTAYHNYPPPFFLISESVRGEGGILLNKNGERFMEKYSSQRELAPRDIVSRAIYSEMKKTDSDHVYLDVTHLSAHFLKNRFPTIYKKCLENGLDMAVERIPVSPAAHYICGGIKTDMDGKTDIISLYAGGETACTGVHGANRLASNSLLESVVFAYRAAVNADRYLRYLPQVWSSKMEESFKNLPIHKGKNSADPEFLENRKKELQNIMWTHCGIERTDAGLNSALKKIKSLNDDIEKIYSQSIITNENIQLRNLSQVAILTLQAAGKRRRNIGTHFNLDLT